MSTLSAAALRCSALFELSGKAGWEEHLLSKSRAPGTLCENNAHRACLKEGMSLVRQQKSCRTKQGAGDSSSIRVIFGARVRAVEVRSSVIQAEKQQGAPSTSSDTRASGNKSSEALAVRWEKISTVAISSSESACGSSALEVPPGDLRAVQPHERDTNGNSLLDGDGEDEAETWFSVPGVANGDCSKEVVPQMWRQGWNQPFMEPSRSSSALPSMKESLAPWLFQLEDGRGEELQGFAIKGEPRRRQQDSGEAIGTLEDEEGRWTDDELEGILSGEDAEEEWGQYRQRLRVRKPALFLRSESPVTEGRREKRVNTINQAVREDGGLQLGDAGNEGSPSLQPGHSASLGGQATAATLLSSDDGEGVMAGSQCHPAGVDSRAGREQLFYLESLGVDVVQASMTYPQLKTLSLTELAKKVRYFEFRGLKNKQLAKVLSCCPAILGLDFEADLKPVVHFLRHEAGVGRAELGKVLYRCPRLVCCQVERDLRPVLEFILSLGVKNSGKIIASNPKLLTKSIQNDLLPRMRFFEELGVPKRDVVAMFRRLPSLFNYSTADNVSPKVDFLVNTMGRSLEEGVSFPQYFSCSLERRIKPRYDFFVQHHCAQISLANLLCSNQEFAQRYSSL